MKEYNVFFLHEWQIPEPVYYFVDQLKANNPYQVLKNNLPHLARKVRAWLGVDEEDLDDGTVEESLFIVPSDSWVSSKAVNEQIF